MGSAHKCLATGDEDEDAISSALGRDMLSVPTPYLDLQSLKTQSGVVMVYS